MKFRIRAREEWEYFVDDAKSKEDAIDAIKNDCDMYRDEFKWVEILEVENVDEEPQHEYTVLVSTITEFKLRAGNKEEARRRWHDVGDWDDKRILSETTISIEGDDDED